MSKKTRIMILAAGHGKRMKTTLPKVLVPLCGQPLIFRVLDELREVSQHYNRSLEIAVVVGFGKEQVIDAIQTQDRFSELKIQFIAQEKLLGTGDAARSVMNSKWGQEAVRSKEPILVLPGDLPLISDQLVSAMLEPLSRSSVLRLLTCELPDPTGYGRVVRKGKNSNGDLQKIVEEKDADPKTRAIKEVAASIYLFDSKFLSSGLKKLKNNNAQKEYYLPDLIGQAVKLKKKTEVLKWAFYHELRGVNNPWELAEAARFLNQRVLKKWALEGVQIHDTQSVWIEPSVELSESVVIHPGVSLKGNTQIGPRAEIGSHVVLENVVVGEESVVKTGTVAQDSVVGKRVQLGPYAHLRPQSEVGDDSKIGNFVELKKAKIGKKTSVAHLSYLGDATVGERVNIGCGFVTCNFDGRVIEGKRKHPTIIEDNVFMGSDCQVVAPVKIGKGSYVASGSTITEDVPRDSLAIARTRQSNKEGYAKKYRGSSHPGPRVEEGL